MSHFTTIRTEILDFEMLRKTIADLGYAMQEDTEIAAHEGLSQKVDLAIYVGSESYLGFRKEAKAKGYSVICPRGFLTDEKNRRIIQMIRQEYAYRKVLHETRKRGFSLIQEERVKPGVIKLILKKVA
jgi:hypothetical protein